MAAMGIEEFKRLSGELKVVAERYYKSGIEGSIPETLSIEMKEAGDKYNEACQRYFSILKNEPPLNI